MNDKDRKHELTSVSTSPHEVFEVSSFGTPVVDIGLYSNEAATCRFLFFAFLFLALFQSATDDHIFGVIFWVVPFVAL